MDFLRLRRNGSSSPIINTPEDCAEALAEGRVDDVATARRVYGAPPEAICAVPSN